MTGAHPQLSIALRTFSAEDPGSWSDIVEQAKTVESAGFDRLVISDHVVFGEALDDYGRPELGGQAGGRQPTGPDGHWLEPLTTLTFLAAATSHIRLGTAILIAALRRPVVLAKSAATLDVLSGGRLDLGVGVGWQRAEYEAAGLDFSRRGRLLDHTLEVCQTLWTQARADYRSAELEFTEVHMMPKPSQAGGIPLWISGTVNRHVVNRLARFGSGWIPWGPAAADVVSGIRQMREALTGAGRDPTTLQVVGHLPLVRDSGRVLDVGRTIDPVPGLTAAGVTDFRVMGRLPAERSEALDQASGLVAGFREAVGD